MKFIISVKSGNNIFRDNKYRENMISVLGHAEFELQLQYASRGVDCK